MDFSSLNPYQTIAAIEADGPAELVQALKNIKTPIKIVQIVTIGSRQVAYIMGDVRNTTTPKKTKGN